MTNENYSILELAKQGDVNAIESILNKQLEAKNITAKVVCNNSYLQVILIAQQVPQRQFIAAFIYKKITNLDIKSVEKLKIHGKQIGDEFPAWSQEFDLMTQQQHKPIDQDFFKAFYISINKYINKVTKTKVKKVLIKNKSLYIFITCLLLFPLTLLVVAKSQNYSQLENTNINRGTQQFDTSIETYILGELNILNQYVETSPIENHDYLLKLDEFKIKVAEYVKARDIRPEDTRTKFQEYLASAIVAHNLAFYILSDCSTPGKEYECSNVTSRAEREYNDLNKKSRNFEDHDLLTWAKALWVHAKEDTGKAQAILDSATSSSSLYKSRFTSPSTSSSTNKAYR